MPRPVRVRVSYVADAKFLVSLAEAIEADHRRDSAWREKSADIVKKAAERLLTAPKVRVRNGRASAAQ